MSLTSNNRVRHSKMLNALMNMNALNNAGKGLKLRTWKWGKLGNRLGSSRSADGVIIDLPDGKSPSGKNVVAKFIFADGETDFKRAKQEYMIGNMMSKAGIGPKVYAFYEMAIPTNVNLENLLKKASGSNSVNLFQGNINASSFNRCIVIIMENLYKGKGLLDTYTAWEGLTKQKYIPFDHIKKLIDKMHSLGIIHADMHQNNIMIQKIRGPLGVRYRPVIIDFGRSLKTNKSFKTMANANAFAMGGRSKSNKWWYGNNGMSVLLNSNGWEMLSKYDPRKPKGPGLMTRIKAKFNKKVNYIENMKKLTNSQFIQYYWRARNNTNATKPGLIKNIILEIAMIKTLLNNSGSGIKNSRVAPFYNKIKNVSGKPVSARNPDYYKIYAALSKLSVSQLQNIKGAIPNLD